MTRKSKSLAPVNKKEMSTRPRFGGAARARTPWYVFRAAGGPGRLGLRNAGGCDTVSVDMDDADRRGVAGAFILGVALPTAAALILLLFS